MSTVLAYLEDTYKFTDKAHFEYVANDERGYYCVLDSTIFYPQGGGQPSDIGSIEVKGVSASNHFRKLCRWRCSSLWRFFISILRKRRRGNFIC